MKIRTVLILLAFLAPVTLTSPVTHAETLSVEQILEMQKARNEAHASQERTDTALILALCESKPDKQCIDSTRKLIAQYKAGIIRIHENDKVFTERMKQATGQ